MSRHKIENLMDEIQRHLDVDLYDLSHHARVRMDQREVDLADVQYVLRHGWHEKRKDSYEEAYQSWNYAIRSETVDKKSLRVIVAFDEEMLVITVIDLDVD
jgi:DNA helicase IV